MMTHEAKQTTVWTAPELKTGSVAGTTAGALGEILNLVASAS